MTDVHNKVTRSYNMSRIRSKNTQPEILVRKFLFANGFRYRINDKRLPGKPDIVLPKYKTVIFINGCFWHGHENCKYFKLPSTRSEWWLDKINKNKVRDNEKNQNLKDEKWQVLVIWECELRSKIKDEILNNLYSRIISKIDTNN